MRPALGSITALAKAAEVSTPTVVRLVQKLGYKGYPDYQQSLRAEVEMMLVSPLVKHDRWAGGVPETHILNRFADQVVTNLQATLGQIDHATFDAAAELLADIARQINRANGKDNPIQRIRREIILVDGIGPSPIDHRRIRGFGKAIGGIGNADQSGI